MGELEAGFRAGHEAAVRAVVQRYGGAVSTVARSMIREPELVDEVVQQTFLNAWRAAASFDEERDLAPWLYAIARRTAIDVLRRERRPTAGAHESEVDVAVTPVSFEETFEAFEIRRAIDGLANEERAVVELSHRYGFTHSEIAERLGIPVGTVKSRSARAHRRLAAALGHLAPGANQAGVANVEGGADLS